MDSFCAQVDVLAPLLGLVLQSEHGLIELDEHGTSKVLSLVVDPCQFFLRCVILEERMRKVIRPGEVERAS